MNRYENHRCACSFAKAVGEKDPTQFPRIGMVENILLRGNFLIQHKGTGRVTAIFRNREGGGIPAEADECCFKYFGDPRASE